MKDHPHPSKKRLCFCLATSLLPLLMATAPIARADGDLIDYRDVVRLHDELARPSHGSGTRVTAATRVAYLLRPTTRGSAARIIVSADRPQPAAGSSYFVSFPNAEATGAAQGQTVNRATNDLN